jgi:hypothetical protein
MITGLPPFYSRNRETMFEKIMKAELNFPQQISEVRASCVVSVGLTLSCAPQNASVEGVFAAGCVLCGLRRSACYVTVFRTPVLTSLVSTR